MFLKGLVVDMYVDPKFGNPPKKKVSTEIWGCFSLARMGFSYVQPFVFGGNRQDFVKVLLKIVENAVSTVAT